MKIMNYKATDFNGDLKSATISNATMKKIKEYESKGYEIHINKNWRQPKRFENVVKICQTNNRYNGMPKHVIWAVK